MLTNEVKQRINTCRDILVGKLPDPKSQVLQITNALIYKFMDDQDRMAEQLGGKPSFFVKDLKPYAWHKLFDSRLDNQERAEKYIEGLEKLSNAKHLPILFQEIFKEAYIPFKAAATITMFLDEINKFDYHHSEELGNAYEYLLNIMGTQADAGQFRTPRHIIEFIVDVVDPKKNETIYDPAAGTAGFLISAYKHILEENKKLSATERNNISKNISGVDISPDMAKMARVNLYLHGFLSPHIEEGDTLSDENLWGKKYDVILANPPFMSPKGGIIPHDRFAIKAKRSEVLFVDYIAEHLKLKGRAGIIVPEGVIFQSGTAYKDLRKMLVEDGYLHAVISLPAGVFQPYSGVKTSILILDREKAKESKEVLFLKVENDGYSQSTQRAVRDGNQLPEALAVARAWRKGKKQESSIASWVSKKEIAKSGEYNLSGERYRSMDAQASTWPIIALQDLCEIYQPKTITSKEILEKGTYKVYGANGVIGYYDKFNHENSEVAVTCRGATCGTVNFTEPKSWITGNAMIISPKNDSLHRKYLYYLLRSMDLTSVISGSAQPQITAASLKPFKIPLPPLDVQKEIVDELNRYQKIIDGARQIVDNYKPTFKIDPKWEVIKLGEVAGINNTNVKIKNDVKYNYIDISSVGNNSGDIEIGTPILGKDLPSRAKRKVDTGDVLLSTVRPNLKAFAYIRELPNNPVVSTGFAVISAREKVLGPWIYYMVLSDYMQEQMITKMGKGSYPSINQNDVKNLRISLPPIEVQEEIVTRLEKEKTIVDANKELMTLYEQKIQDKIAEVWGE